MGYTNKNNSEYKKMDKLARFLDDYIKDLHQIFAEEDWSQNKNFEIVKLLTSELSKVIKKIDDHKF